MAQEANKEKGLTRTAINGYNMHPPQTNGGYNGVTYPPKHIQQNQYIQQQQQHPQQHINGHNNYQQQMIYNYQQPYQAQYNYNNNINNNIPINNNINIINNNNNNNNNNPAEIMRFHHVQKSSSFKPSLPAPVPTPTPTPTPIESKIDMDIDISTFEPILIQAFSKEIHEYNTEVELTFGGTINFIEKLAIFVSNIDSYKMNDIISIVLSKKKQDVFLTETVTIQNNNNINTQYQQSKIKNNNNQIDQKPVYVRSILQLIYYSFLNYICNDYKYKDFYKAYYEDNNNNQSLSITNNNNNNNNRIIGNGNDNNNKPKPKPKSKSKSKRQEDIDPFFQCFYECLVIYNIYNKTSNINGSAINDLREYLELITSRKNTINVLKLMNGVILWVKKIKINSIRLTLTELNIDISLYEFSQLLQCIHLQTQHAVWQRVQKNDENQIADKQNLSLCIHILLCIAIKDKNETGSQQKYPNTQNDKIYSHFLDKIVRCLIDSFLISNSNNKKPSTIIIMEFGDLVEKLPLWLLHVDKLLQSQQS